MKKHIVVYTLHDKLQQGPLLRDEVTDEQLKQIQENPVGALVGFLLRETYASQTGQAGVQLCQIFAQQATVMAFCEAGKKSFEITPQMVQEWIDTKGIHCKPYSDTIIDSDLGVLTHYFPGLTVPGYKPTNVHEGPMVTAS